MKRVVVSLIALVALAPWTGALAQQSPQPGQSSEPSSQSSAPPPSQPSTPTAQTAPGPSQGNEVEVAADSLVGSKVRNAQGQDIGTVSKLFVDAQRGTITRVVVKQGGGLGMGGKEVAVPWSAIKVQRDQNTLVVTMQQETLPQAPQQQGKQGKDQGNGGSPSASPPGDQKR